MTGTRRPALLAMDDSIFFKLVRVVNLTARPFVESIGRAHHLTLNEWRVMLVLASHPGSAAQEVVAHTGLDKMTVSRALSGLQRRGRLVRREDAADKRRALLTLSSAGFPVACITSACRRMPPSQRYGCSARRISSSARRSSWRSRSAPTSPAPSR